MNKPIVTFLTGIPGTGKSTTAKAIEAKCIKNGLNIKFFNDYPYLIAWAKQNRDDESKVRWFMQENGEENFDIHPNAYPVMSRWVAEQIALEIQKGEAHIYVVESARGAGVDGARDRYDLDLFKPFLQTLGERVNYINIEMIVKNFDAVIERMDRRLLTEGNAAPSFVAKKYVSLEDGIQSSFAQVPEGQRFVVNEIIDNSGHPNETALQAAGIVAQIMALAAREGFIPENPEGGTNRQRRK